MFEQFAGADLRVLPAREYLPRLYGCLVRFTGVLVDLPLPLPRSVAGTGVLGWLCAFCLRSVLSYFGITVHCRCLVLLFKCRTGFCLPDAYKPAGYSGPLPPENSVDAAFT